MQPSPPPRLAASVAAQELPMEQPQLLDALGAGLALLAISLLVRWWTRAAPRRVVGEEPGDESRRLVS